jgi:hypothetical protein
MPRKLRRSYDELKEIVPPFSNDYKTQWTIVDVQGRDALRFEGDGHCIKETQRSHNYPAAISYLKAMSSALSHVEVGYAAASVLFDAISHARHMYDLSVSDCDDILYPDFDEKKFYGKETDLTTIAIQEIYGSHMEEDKAVFNSNLLKEANRILEDRGLLDKANRILKGQEAFCYDFCGETVLGIAFAQVEIGDYVIRPATLDGVLSAPSQFVLIARPYSPPGCETPGLFRLVGACVDSYRKLCEDKDIDKDPDLAWEWRIDVSLL